MTIRVIPFVAVVFCLLRPPLQEDGLPGKTQHLTSADQVPEGLAKSDWQSIRAAYDAGRHAFRPVEPSVTIVGFRIEMRPNGVFCVTRKPCGPQLLISPSRFSPLPAEAVFERRAGTECSDRTPMGSFFVTRAGEFF